MLRHALHIDIPDSLHEMALDEELVRATEVEGLWIERVGCSRIVVTLANHQGVLFPADMATVAMWIQQHTVRLLVTRVLLPTCRLTDGHRRGVG